MNSGENGSTASDDQQAMGRWGLWSAYLDVIRRYPCIELERQRALRNLVDLKVSFEGGSMADLLSAWNLDETETPNTKAILPYQTRHYAAERRK